MVALILAHQIYFQENILDLAIWKPTTDGKFLCSFAWDLIRMKRGKSVITTMTWSNYILLKCLFYLWRTLRGKLPTNEKIVAFGHKPAEYYCWTVAGQDTTYHICVVGRFANYLELFC